MRAENRTLGGAPPPSTTTFPEVARDDVISEQRTKRSRSPATGDQQHRDAAQKSEMPPECETEDPEDFSSSQAAEHPEVPDTPRGPRLKKFWPKIFQKVENFSCSEVFWKYFRIQGLLHLSLGK